MQRNIHTPERAATESVADYRARRALSAEHARRNSQVGSGGQCTREALRNEQRKSGAMAKVAGSYGRGLRNWINRKQAALMANKRPAHAS